MKALHLEETWKDNIFPRRWLCGDDGLSSISPNQTLVDEPEEEHNTWEHLYTLLQQERL